MDGLALQIDGKWAVLSDDDSVNIENNSPVWGDGNSFSLPFQLDIEANRHILGNADQITGQSVYEVLDGKRGVLYTLGIPVYYGKVKIEDEVELAEGKVDITLVSGNLTFEEMIEGMNCQDVELMDEIVIGEVYSKLSWHFTHKSTGKDAWITAPAPNGMMWPAVDGKSTVNITDAYPLAKYCNTRICYQVPEDSSDVPTDLTTELKTFQSNRLDEIISGKYVVLDAERTDPGICFYVLYFLDCLFHKLGIDYSNKNIQSMEDMNRLAFFTTRCEYDERLYEEKSSKINLYQEFFYTMPGWIYDSYNHEFRPDLSLCVANSKNFPDMEVSEVMDGLKNAFGIRFIMDEKAHIMSAYYIKDILKDKSFYHINSVEIVEVYKQEIRTDGFRLKYASGGDDDYHYNYSDWKIPNFVSSYNLVLLSIAPFEKGLFIDKRNGNAYRVMVDKEATTEAELNPVLTEVGEFNHAQYGNCDNEDFVETIEIGFNPVIVNDVRPAPEKKNMIPTFESNQDDSANDQKLAPFLDVSMKYPAFSPKVKVGGVVPNSTYQVEIAYRYWTDQRFDESYADTSVKNRKDGSRYIELVDQKSPIQEYDTGFTLGFMRGPGNEAGVEDFDGNYDGEGNFKYTMVAEDYAFHNDTVDNYARLFDYNGTEPGGVDVEGRISLKIKAEKPVDASLKSYYPIGNTYAQKRGLFDKFYSEYSYFVVNRKVIKMKCHMEMADLLNIDWTKRYKIGEYIGFITKSSYSVNSSGISDVELEMYYI